MKRVRMLFLHLAALSAWGPLAACSTGTSASASKSQEAAVSATPSADQAALALAQTKKLGTPQPKLPIGSVLLETAPRAPLTLKVEVASTDAQRQSGLMFRASMGDDEGMLFLFSTERHNSFWMHNTLIPLDMLFIDSEWRVVGIVERATPQTDDPRNVPNMSQYVLEVNGGLAAKHGLGTDTMVRFTPPPETTR